MSVDNIIKQCLRCNKEIITTQSRIDRGDGKFCSRECCLDFKRSEKELTVCPECGISFPKKIDGRERKYCSVDCRIKAKKAHVFLNCNICGKEHKRKNSKINDSGLYFCSRKCYDFWKSNYYVWTPPLNPLPKKEPKCSEVISEHCGITFNIKDYIIKGRKHLFCSKKCKHDFHSIITNCKLCGKPFSVLKGSMDKYLYCSKDCAKKNVVLMNVGENNPMYKKDKIISNRYLRYTYEGTEFIKNVYKKDNWKCVICGKSKDLNAHHLNSFTRFKELRYDVNNGVTLCKPCHKEFHSSFGRKTFTEENFYNFIKNKN
jgi:YHS domain-containing protein